MKFMFFEFFKLARNEMHVLSLFKLQKKIIKDMIHMKLDVAYIHELMLWSDTCVFSVHKTIELIQKA